MWQLAPTMCQVGSMLLQHVLVSPPFPFEQLRMLAGKHRRLTMQRWEACCMKAADLAIEREIRIPFPFFEACAGPAWLAEVAASSTWQLCVLARFSTVPVEFQVPNLVLSLQHVWLVSHHPRATGTVCPVHDFHTSAAHHRYICKLFAQAHAMRVSDTPRYVCPQKSSYLLWL
jgi:hypothetical protein